jgi:hypothetical protein
MGDEGLRSLEVRLTPFTRYHHIDLLRPAFGADQFFAPIGHWRFGAVPSSHLGRIGLDLMAQPLDHAINRTWVAAALPSVNGGPDSDFTGVAAVPGGELVLARALLVSAIVAVSATAVLRATSRGFGATFGCAKTTESGRFR